ncbi:Substrate of Polo-like kinase in the basal body 1 [Trypanosoma cruzi]|uniref:Substrate of Polo-like kinase in the basal body 1 n=1 Tax=Trypanosoma cruzi TaxID=5693 RepID=A0A7J6YCY3_TRYCR|nr:Substrate of Polo-like kinase in the basal body 1 [Trypanosoma cruzi]
MSGDGDSSLDPSILVVEARFNESLGNQSVSGGGGSERWQHHEEKQQQQQQPLSLPPRSRGDVNWNASSSSSPSTIEEAEGGDGDRRTADRRWSDDGSNAGNDRDGGIETNEENEDDIAERVLRALRCKDMLMDEQARKLQRREMEARQLRRELDELRGEKQLLMQQLRGFLDGSTPMTTASETGPLKDSGQLYPSMLLQRADSQLQDERAERQQDARHFMAHIEQLTAQLAEAQHEARTREARHAQDLDTIQQEMQELSTVVDDMHATKAALCRTQEQLAKANEEKAQCQLERDRLVRSLQEALRREGSEHQRTLERMRAEAGAYERAKAAAEAKCRRAEAEQLKLAEELRALRIEMQQLVDENAALTLRMESSEQQLRRAQKQHVEERAAEAEARRRLQEELDAKVREMAQLRSTRDAQSQLLVEEEGRHALFQAEVEECVQSTRQLEEALMRCERRRCEAEERETRVAAERDALRVQLQRVTAASRQELLEQQQLTEEMRSFHQAKLQQMQQAAEHQRQRAERLEEKSEEAVREYRTLQALLDSTQRQMEEVAGELHELRQQRMSLESMLAETQQENNECAAREKNAAAQLDAIRSRLKQRECAWRELRAKMQRLEEGEQRRRLAEAADSLLRMRQNHHSQGKCKTKLQTCIRDKISRARLEENLLDNIAGVDVNTTLSTKEPSSMTAPPPPPETKRTPLRGPQLNAWQAKLQALEARNANLERQLASRQIGHRALVEDRKALHQQMHTLQETAQGLMSALERQHRDAIKHLEEAHRRRTLVACREASDALASHESCVRSGVVRVVSELMAFIRALEANATLVSRHHECLQEAPVQMADDDDKENMLRAACDDITRNFLGVEGGWEALLQHSLRTTSGRKSSRADGGSLTAAMRRRIRFFLMDYLQAQLLGKPAAAVLPALRRQSGNKKKALNVSFAASSDGSTESHDDWDEERENCGERPLVELLMERVRCVYGDDTPY